MSGLPTNLEGYGENVCSINGPIVCHGVMQGTEFREENARKNQKNKWVAPFFIWAK